MRTRLFLAPLLLLTSMLGIPGTSTAEVIPETCFVAVSPFRPAGSADADQARAVSEALVEALSALPDFDTFEEPIDAERLAESYLDPFVQIEERTRYTMESSVAADLIVIGRVCDLGDVRSVVAKVVSMHTGDRFMVRRVCAPGEQAPETGRHMAGDIATRAAEHRVSLLPYLIPPGDRFASMPDSFRGPAAPRVALATMPWQRAASSNRVDLARASWMAAGELLDQMGFAAVSPDDPYDWNVNAVIALNYTHPFESGSDARITVRVTASDAEGTPLYDRMLFRRIPGKAMEEEEAAAAGHLTAHMLLDLAPRLFGQSAAAPASIPHGTAPPGR